MEQSLYMQAAQVQQLAQELRANMARVIVGKDAVLDKAVLCLLCAGHILLEDVPGTGKTTLAKSLARSLACTYRRVQFTPDLLPSDLTGIQFYNQKTGEFVFRQGALFCQVLLADEINRATPRTQSSLLECMEEGQISVDGDTFMLDKPFLVIATQNPIEIQGTFPLPEAQLDRFFMRLAVGYPQADDEASMLERFCAGTPLETLGAVTDGAAILAAQDAVRRIRVGDAVRAYIVRIVQATRESDKVRLGASPRGSLALLHAAQGHAAMGGRDFAAPDDVKAVCMDVLAHRVLCKGYGLSQSGDAARELLRQILVQVSAPTE